MRYLEFPDLGNEDRFPYSQETCKVTAERKGSKINDTAYCSRSNPSTGVLRQKLSLKLVDECPIQKVNSKPSSVLVFRC